MTMSVQASMITVTSRVLPELQLEFHFCLTATHTVKLPVSDHPSSLIPSVVAYEVTLLVSCEETPP